MSLLRKSYEILGNRQQLIGVLGKLPTVTIIKIACALS